MGRKGQCALCAESSKVWNGWNYCGRYKNYCKCVARNCPSPKYGPKIYKDDDAKESEKKDVAPQ